MPFLSLLDPRLKPKGSRDPLGFEQVWTQFGNQIVGNLTTITSSLENFAVALLGFHWANEMHQGADSSARHDLVSTTFLKYEQLAAYLRFQSETSNEIMGITRVRSRMEDETIEVLTLGLKDHEVILSDQRGYGLWGFYSSALRDSGLVHGNERELTPIGHKVIQFIEKRLDKFPFIQRILEGSVSRAEIDALRPDFMASINAREVTDLLVGYLMGGDRDTTRIQNELWRQTQALVANKGLGVLDGISIRAFVHEITALNSTSPELKKCLEQISVIEQVLVVMNHLFHYCRGKNGVSLDDIEENLAEKHYDFTYLPEVLPAATFANKGLIEKATHSLRLGQYREAIQTIAELNKKVMFDRQGPPWLEIENSSQLKVRVSNEKAKLLSNEELLERWDYDYFLGSFLSIARKYLGMIHGY
jgi:hypothetical protein